eukprot:6114717-Alexandrium_andersonii.AAC.1
MSASLVGSEMCIRDSRPFFVVEETATDVFAHGTEYAARRICRVFGGGPVSYTHLTLPTICSV